MAGQERNYYSVLGIGRDASAVEIDRAYRRAARATHPDVNPKDSAAAERFNAVTIAYQTLRSPEQRASYDRANAAARSPAPVTIVRRRSPMGGVAPVHLGPRPPRTEPREPFGARYAVPVEPVADDLFDVFVAFSRLLNSWGLP